MPAKEMPCSASVEATRKPMSSVGRKPLGMTMNSPAVTPSKANDSHSVVRR